MPDGNGEKLFANYSRQLNNYEDLLRGDSLKDVTDFLMGVSTLVEVLRNNVEPTLETNQLEFINHQDDIYAFPETIRDRLLTRELEYICVILSRETGNTPNTAIEFADEDGIIRVSRDGLCEEDALVPDQLITSDGSLRDLNHIPNCEINAFLLSLASMYKDAELTKLNPQKAVINSQDIHNSLIKNALGIMTFYEYSMPSGRVIRFSTHESNGSRYKLIDFSLSYEISENSRMIVEINQQTNLSINFKRQIENKLTPLYPDGGDYVRLVEIMLEELDEILSIVNLET